MKNEFVTYEQALDLKKLGFNEECLGSWNLPTSDFYYNPCPSKFESDDVIQLPLKQQVFKWFREKHNVIGLIEGGYTEGKNVFSYVIWRESDDDWTYDYYDDYEKVENMLIDKLIEVLRQKKDGERKN